MEFQPTLYDTELIQSHNLESKVVLKEKYSNIIKHHFFLLPRGRHGPYIPMALSQRDSIMSTTCPVCVLCFPQHYCLLIHLSTKFRNCCYVGLMSLFVAMVCSHRNVNGELEAFVFLLCKMQVTLFNISFIWV